jgi:hypothetical protein
MNLLPSLSTSDRVRVIVRSFLHATPDKPQFHWTGTVSAVESHGIWVVPDGVIGRAEFVAWCEIEHVLVM